MGYLLFCVSKVSEIPGRSGWWAPYWYLAANTYSGHIVDSEWEMLDSGPVLRSNDYAIGICEILDSDTTLFNQMQADAKIFSFALDSSLDLLKWLDIDTNIKARLINQVGIGETVQSTDTLRIGIDKIFQELGFGSLSSIVDRFNLNKKSSYMI